MKLLSYMEQLEANPAVHQIDVLLALIYIIQL